MLNHKIFLFGLLFISVFGVIKVRAAMFVFGDSLYDPGNNNNLSLSIADKANHWPYGETFFHYSTGRYCDGRILPDFIAMDANLPLWKPYLEPHGTQQSFKNGADFAAGGAAVISENQPGGINLKDQLFFFKNATNELRKEVGEEEAKKILMEAVYLSSIGGVDCNTFFVDHPNSTLTEKEEYVKLVIANITYVIKEIYEMGGRKFAFQNVGPIGCLPSVKQSLGLDGDECAEQLLEIAKVHNNFLLKAAEELEDRLQGFKYLVFDYYTSLLNIIQNHSNYGFKVANVACCGYGTNRGVDCGVKPYELCSNPNEYVFFDGDHPCERVNILLSHLLWNGKPNVTVPRNLKQLYELKIISNLSLRNYVGNATNDAI